MPNKIKTAKPKWTSNRALGDNASIETNRFTSSTRWRKLRAIFLTENPMCVLCLATEPVSTFTFATEVHHLVSRAEAPDRALDWSNLQALCNSCHSKVTAKERPFYRADT